MESFFLFSSNFKAGGGAFRKFAEVWGLSVPNEQRFRKLESRSPAFLTNPF